MKKSAIFAILVAFLSQISSARVAHELTDENFEHDT